MSSPAQPKVTSATPVILWAILIALLIPPMVFFVVALFAGMGMADATQSLLDQYKSDRQNLAFLGAIGILPILLLALVVWIVGKLKRARVGQQQLAIGGAAGILAVLVWVNFEYWPTFLPNKIYAGFPHGLEFVIGPLIFAPIAMVVGMLIAAFVPRARPDE